MVAHQPKDGHTPEGCILLSWNLALRTTTCDPPSQRWSPNNSKMVTHHKGNNRWQLPWRITYYGMDCHPPTRGWTPTNPRMATHQPKLGHPFQMNIGFASLEKNSIWYFHVSKHWDHLQAIQFICRKKIGNSLVGEYSLGLVKVKTFPRFFLWRLP